MEYNLYKIKLGLRWFLIAAEDEQSARIMCAHSNRMPVFHITHCEFIGTTDTPRIELLKEEYMNYYTNTIPPTLAGKLKEKGMPITITEDIVDFCTENEHEELTTNCIYAEVFDWLMERGLRIVIEPSWDFANERITDMWDCDIVRVGAFSSQPKTTISQHDTWHEAAEKAIEKALTLI